MRDINKMVLKVNFEDVDMDTIWDHCSGVQCIGCGGYFAVELDLIKFPIECPYCGAGGYFSDEED